MLCARCCRRQEPPAKPSTIAPARSYGGTDLLLSADVGGTSSRLHLFPPPSGPAAEGKGKDGDSTQHIEDRDLIASKKSIVFENKYYNAKFESFAGVLEEFLKDSGMDGVPTLACLAVAGSVVDNRAELVNLGWTISGKELEEKFGIGRIVLINDFEAQGYGVLTLDEKTECDVLQGTEPLERAPKAVIGPGTGLGEAFLTVNDRGEYDVWPSEGGHAEFAPRQDGSSKVQFDMLQHLQIKFSARSRISVERVVSGKGISNIYEFLAWKFPEKVNRVVHDKWLGPVNGPRLYSPSVIADAATSGECSLCQEAMDIFVGAFGAEAGALGLTYMPFGGLYLTGGVTAKNREYILGLNCGRPKHFMEAFLDKGRVSHMLKRVPVYLVRAEDTGERGAMLKAARLYKELLLLRQGPPRGHMGCIDCYTPKAPTSSKKQVQAALMSPKPAEEAASALPGGLAPTPTLAVVDTLLAADIGGTSSRLHLFRPPAEDAWRRPQGFVLTDECKIRSKQFKNARYDSFSDLLQEFLELANLPAPPKLACLAVAGAVVDNTVTFVNLGWRLDGLELESQFNINRVVLINDFEAQGYGVLTLQPEKDTDVLQDVAPLDCAPKAVIGAGTGLGEAFLTMGENDEYDVWPSEGGHAEFAPRQEGSSKLQFEMLQYLQIKFSSRSRISVERIISGRGLSNIYEFLAWRFPEKVNATVHRAWMGPVEGPRLFDPAAITKAAAAGECELCQRAVSIFVDAYGAEAGVLSLKYMPFGGLYLTGGVTAKLSDFIIGKQGRAGAFMDSFKDKGRVSNMLSRVPVYKVRGEDMGERGAILKACRLYGTFKQNLQDSRGHMACLRSDGKHSGPLGVLKPQPPPPTLIQVRPKTPAVETHPLAIAAAIGGTVQPSAEVPAAEDRMLLLSGDIGSTVSRLHLFWSSEDTPKAAIMAINRDILYEERVNNYKFEEFDDVLKSFLANAQQARPDVKMPPVLACIAVSETVVNNKVNLVNAGWTIDGSELMEKFKIAKVVLIKDVEAQGYGLLTLDHEKDVEVLQQATPLAMAPRAVIGVGSGLGEAFLTMSENGDYKVWPSEGGHAEFAPRQDGASKLQFEMLKYLQIKFSAKARISVERVVSGKGLSNIYEFLAWEFPEKVNPEVHRRWLGPFDKPTQMDPVVIADAARTGECPLCQQAVDLFAGAYGAEAGVLALTYLPFGGLYLCGGVTVKMFDMIRRAGVQKSADGKSELSGYFMKAFLDKGHASPLLKKVPVYIVHCEDLGERGVMLKAQRLALDMKRRPPSLASGLNTQGGANGDGSVEGQTADLDVVELDDKELSSEAPVLLSARIGIETTQLELLLAPKSPGEMKDQDLFANISVHYAASYKNAFHDTFDAVLTAFLKDAGASSGSPLLACLSLMDATIANSQAVVVPKVGWTIDTDALQRSFNFKKVCLITGCEAQAYGILTLSSTCNKEVIQAAEPVEGAPKVVMHVGHDLRQSFLTIGCNKDYEVWPTEGGHAEFASRQDGHSRLQFEMLQFLQIKYSARSRISVHRVVSGGGLSNIYEFLAWKFPEKVKEAVHARWVGSEADDPVYDPEVVLQSATCAECELCTQAIDVFIGAFAATCGVAALQYEPFGGVFLTGDMAHHLRDFLMGRKGIPGHFMESFLDKGRVSKMLTNIPVYLVCHQDMAERGVRLKAGRMYQELQQCRLPAAGHIHH